MFFYVFYCGVNVIVSGEWEIVSIIKKILNGTIKLSDLFMPHNQHIIFFPRIFKILFAFLTKYNNIAEMYVILFLMMVSFSIFYLYFKKSFNYKKVIFWFIPISFLLFSLRQFENMLSGFQITYLFASIFSILTLYFIFILEEKKKEIVNNLFFGSSIVCGIVASFSSFIGLFVWKRMKNGLQEVSKYGSFR